MVLFKREKKYPFTLFLKFCSFGFLKLEFLQTSSLGDLLKMAASLKALKVEPNSQRCTFFLIKKKKYCKFPKYKGEKFCSHHRARSQCPHCHTLVKDLKIHVKCCPQVMPLRIRCIFLYLYLSLILMFCCIYRVKISPHIF